MVEVGLEQFDDFGFVEKAVEFAAFDLVGGEAGNHVVYVGAAGDVDGQGVGAVVEVVAATAGSVDALPGFDVGVAVLGKDAGGLAHDDEAAVGDLGGEAEDDVGEGGHVQGFGIGRDVEGGVDAGVGFDEGFDLDFAAAAEQGVVGSHVEGYFFVAAGGDGSFHEEIIVCKRQEARGGINN